MTRATLQAFLVHAYTASGAVLALLIVLAVWRSRPADPALLAPAR